MRIRVGWVVAGLIGLAGTAGSPVESLAQEVAATDGTGLISESPVFPAVVPPSRYQDAIDKGTRDPNGRPGPEYWQQRADYRIAVEIEPETARLTGSESITYYNESPDELNTIVVRFYQNVFSEGVARNRSVTLTGGVDLDRMALNGT